VVDLETTGLYLSTDRVVEVGIVLLDANAEITGQFCSLINPGRDVGPSRLHGIAAADVCDAPTFADAAATLWQLLTRRVLVAHNAAPRNPAHLVAAHSPAARHRQPHRPPPTSSEKG
jgi:DNA polymerase III subunit epsilon